ncbi:MAG: endonuclease III [Flavobacteriales bacterium]|nr:endonuclease III [Flavobacteriales bacterium]MCC6939511.1 endonuclease III [Flavobacteriales bacterium]
MTRSEKAAFVSRTLAELYPRATIPLDHEDPYTLLVAVVLSAQCTDKKVNEITPLLFAKARTPQQMVKLEVHEIEDIIRPCGLAPAKAKGIHGLSRIILDEHGGKVPNTMSALEALPSVGHKTASVVMVQVFGVPAFPVDTHIHRLAWRWTLSTGKNVERTEADLKKLFPQEEWADLHLRIIYFGREHCPAKGHDPRKCPICSVIGRKELFA